MSETYKKHIVSVNGSGTVSIPFEWSDPNEVCVYCYGSVGPYTGTLAGMIANGWVSLLGAPGGDIMTHFELGQRVWMVLSRQTALDSYSTLRDLLKAIDELRAEVQCTFRVPETFLPVLAAFPATTRKGKALVFDDNGNPALSDAVGGADVKTARDETLQAASDVKARSEQTAASVEDAKQWALKSADAYSRFVAAADAILKATDDAVVGCKQEIQRLLNNADVAGSEKLRELQVRFEQYVSTLGQAVSSASAQWDALLSGAMTSISEARETSVLNVGNSCESALAAMSSELNHALRVIRECVEAYGLELTNQTKALSDELLLSFNREWAVSAEAFAKKAEECAAECSVWASRLSEFESALRQRPTSSEVRSMIPTTDVLVNELSSVFVRPSEIHRHLPEDVAFLEAANSTTRSGSRHGKVLFTTTNGGAGGFYVGGGSNSAPSWTQWQSRFLWDKIRAYGHQNGVYEDYVFTPEENGSNISLQIARKKDITDLLSELILIDGGAVHTSGDETIEGVKTFTVSPKAPTAPRSSNDTTVATTGFVNVAIASALQSYTPTGSFLPLSGGEISGNLFIGESLTVLPLGFKTPLGADACGLHVSANGGLQLFGTHFMLGTLWDDTPSDLMSGLKAVTNNISLYSTSSAAIGFDYANTVIFRTMPNDGSEATYKLEAWQWDDDSHASKSPSAGVKLLKPSQVSALESTSVLNMGEGDARWAAKSDLDAKANSTDVVTLSGSQSIIGNKSFIFLSAGTAQISSVSVATMKGYSLGATNLPAWFQQVNSKTNVIDVTTLKQGGVAINDLFVPVSGGTLSGPLTVPYFNVNGSTNNSNWWFDDDGSGGLSLFFAGANPDQFYKFPYKGPGQTVATLSDLSGYLPKAGGDITGNIIFKNSYGSVVGSIRFDSYGVVFDPDSTGKMGFGSVRGYPAVYCSNGIPVRVPDVSSEDWFVLRGELSGYVPKSDYDALLARVEALEAGSSGSGVTPTLSFPVGAADGTKWDSEVASASQNGTTVTLSAFPAAGGSYVVRVYGVDRTTLTASSEAGWLSEFMTNGSVFWDDDLNHGYVAFTVARNSEAYDRTATIRLVSSALPGEQYSIVVLQEGATYGGQ